MTNRSGRAREAARSGRALVGGSARGLVLRLDEPLSLWGGMDPATGRVVAPRHPQAGEILSGRVVVMASGRGSSSSSSVLAEAVRAGTAPAAFVMLEPDPIVVLGAVVAAELYGRTVPVIAVDQATYEDLRPEDEVAVTADGSSATLTVFHRAG